MPKSPFLMSKDSVARLIGVFFLALILFNFPFLRMAGKSGYIWGIPIIYWYIFLVWLLTIGLVQWITRRNKGGRS